MKKLLLVLVAFMITMTGCSSASSSTVSESTTTVVEKVALTDGTYTADVTGHNAPFTVQVTVSDGKVTAIEAVDNQETLGIGKVAIARLTDEIIENQTVGVDSVTGATITSAAIKNGVWSCVEQAGATKENWKRAVEEEALTDETIDTDVVVIGGGGAGMAAAISAANNGAKVVIVEKNGYLGGSTQTSGGAFNCADEEADQQYEMTEALSSKIEGYCNQEFEDETVKQWQQTLIEEWAEYKASGATYLFDTKSLHKIQTYTGGHNVGNPELIDVLCENALATHDWLADLGIEWKTTLSTATGALYQRSHYTVMAAGTGYTETFKSIINDNENITYYLETPATELVTDGTAVTGVVCENNGRTITVNAKSVIIATGGFGSNVTLRQEVNTGVWAEADLGSGIGCSNVSTSAQGDGLELAENVGANLIGLSDIQLHPCGNPTTGLMDAIRTSGRNRIFVNLDGERFVNEGAARDTLCKAIFEQEESTYYVIVNSVRYPSRTEPDGNGETIENMVALGKVVEADTLAELAEKLGMDPEVLQNSVDQYNKAVRGEEEDPFGFEVASSDVELVDGPWYACKKVPTVHHTMGGIEINTNAEVLDTEGAAISGLYAAGEVTGGIHGSNRLGGNAIADIMTFGKIAGEQAAANAQ